MTNRAQYATDLANSARLWSTHIDALDRHLSANTWALAAIPAVLTAYPIARIVIPAIAHSISIALPDVVRTVLNFI
jgi:phage tail protein X